MSRVWAAMMAGLLWSTLALGAEPTVQDPATADRYHVLLEELRCLVCQNESLATSNADLAKDLRREIRQMMARGMSDQEITDYLVARYGDYVLYRPPIKPATYALWFSPLLLLIIALIILGYEMRRRARAMNNAPLTAQEHGRLRRLLAGTDEPGDDK